MTAAQYYRLPEGPPYAQLIGGELITSTSPNFFHQELVLHLAASLRGWVKSRRIGKIVIAPSDVELDEENVLQPDIFFIRQERLGMVDQHGTKGAPDLVVEVISGSTRRLDLGPKKKIYARAGVQEFWAIYPQEKRVEQYAMTEAPEVPVQLALPAGVLQTALLPGWEMTLAELFEP